MESKGGCNSQGSLSSRSSAGSSTGSSKNKPRPRRKGSFAHPTSSSLASGGPRSQAPAPAPAAAKSRSRRPALPPLAVPQNRNDDSHLSTPTKLLSGEDQPPAPVLSPTPYWKAMVEEGRDPSPRQTRSAKKKALTERTLNELDDLEDEVENPSDRSAFDPAGLLQFSSPDFKANARKRREADLKNEKERQLRVRKAASAGMNLTDSAMQKRKKPRKHSATGQRQSMSSDEMRRLLSEHQQSMQEQSNTNSDRLVELAGRAAAAERDVEHQRQLNSELQVKYEKVEAELQRIGAEENAKLKEYEARCHQLEEDRMRFEELANSEKERWDSERAAIEEEHAKSLKKASEEAKRAAQENEDLQSAKAGADTSQKNLLQRITELEESEAMLTDQMSEASGRIASLQSDILGQADDIGTKQSTIVDLQHKLQSAAEETERLKTRMARMTSPSSAEATEQGHLDEIRELEVRLEQSKTNIENLQQSSRQKESDHDADKARLLSDISELKSRLDGASTELTSIESENTRLTEELESTSSKFEENKLQLEEIAEENERLEAELEGKGEMLRTVESEKISLEAKVVFLKKELDDTRTEKSATEEKLTELSSQLSSTTTHLENAKSEVHNLENKLRDNEQYLEQFQSIESRLVQEKHVLNQIRRDLHNKVLQLSGNIRVFVRVRPLVESERLLSLVQGASNTKRPASRPSSANGRPPSRSSLCPRGNGTALSVRTAPPDAGLSPFRFPSVTDRKVAGNPSRSSSPSYTSFHDLSKETIELTEPYKDRGGLSDRRKKYKYGFNRVFSPDSTQNEVWLATEPLVQSALDGMAVTCFAYGQTGAGKTHTMIGDRENPGLIPRSVEKLFAAKRDIEQDGNGTVSIRVELLEIYNEEVRDLLADSGPTGKLVACQVSSNDAVGNIKMDVDDVKDVEGILKLAQERRCVKATKSNSESSRSHLLFTMHFSVLASADGSSRTGRLNIVDLAGSERVAKSGSHGALLTEAKAINSSLSTLSHVIEKLQAKSDHIPFRDSKLTYLLRDSLAGDSKTLAIVCCSPHVSHFSESLNSIRFAAKASKVELKEGNSVSV